ncbi:MAG TPA: ATP-binding cassette domain-containing protein, partial [Burkholderiaceae bacterium]|nr:ATP-binding cassette domain-containing protein [Burkholderiaceae bacterium]
GSRKHVMSYLGEFLFSPQRANSPIKTLSGGERNRLLLARLFARPANLLVLDEPTNDLDIESLELLESTLQGYNGTLLLVSHDRTFLDNVVTQSLVAEGDGRWTEYPGGYSDWLALRPKSAPAPIATLVDPPHGARTAARGGRLKLSFREQRELEALPAKIEALEREQHEITARMNSVEYHRIGVDAIRADRLRATAIEHELAACFERWSLLEDKARAASG